MAELQGKNDLKGLFYVFIALILSLVADVGMSARSNAVTTIMGIVSLAALILILVGLSKVKEVSPHFRKSRNMYIAQLIMTIAIIAALVVAVAGAYSSNTAGVFGGLVVFFVFLILLLVFAILATVNLLQGCANVAMDNKDRVFARKCHTAWRLYVAAVVLTIIAVIIIAVILLNNLSLLQNMSDNQMGDFVGKIGVGAIVLIIAMILTLIAYILKTVRVYQTYKKFGAAAAAPVNG
jgi:uncharacterized membrane protein